jgi:hypothetical protein
MELSDNCVVVRWTEKPTAKELGTAITTLIRELLNEPPDDGYLKFDIATQDNPEELSGMCVVVFIANEKDLPGAEEDD